MLFDHIGHVNMVAMKKALAVSEFKARCLAVLDEVARTGEGVTLLKRGKPLARVVPAASFDHDHPQHRLRGTIEILGDVVAPVLPADAWEVEQAPVQPRRKRAAKKRA
jgi:prevent-host-death family protein